MRYRIIIAIIIILFLTGVVGSALVLTAPQKRCVRVSSDGETVWFADLGTAADTVFDVRCHGHVNTVEIRDHRIRVKSADCPDQTCVEMGWLKSAAMPVVCLPHKLVIEYVSDTADVDAVTR